VAGVSRAMVISRRAIEHSRPDIGLGWAWPTAGAMRSADGATLRVVISMPAIRLLPGSTIPSPETWRDAGEAFTSAIRDALLQVMLDESAPLQLSGSLNWLEIVVVDGSQLSKGPKGKTLATYAVRASDLSRYHQGQISAAEARRRILMTDVSGAKAGWAVPMCEEGTSQNSQLKGR